MSEIPDNIDWSLTSWEGSRRAQLRRWRALSLRQKLLALEEMTEIAEHPPVNAFRDTRGRRRSQCVGECQPTAGHPRWG